MKDIHTPISVEDINNICVGEMLKLSGTIFCGRDAVLPRIACTTDDALKQQLVGSAIFHTAVSIAGVGPTSSNKYEIESSIIPLSRMGVRIHLGKGRITENTIKGINTYNSVFAIIPPVTALLEKNILSREVVAYKELGMEALHRITIQDFPIIIAAAHGRSIFDEKG